MLLNQRPAPGGKTDFNPFCLSRRLAAEVAAWTALVALSIAAVPLFVCMPLWADVTLYDLAARNLLAGGVHYRDIFDTNLPGMVWLQVAVRSLFGWRSESMRLCDLAVVSAIVALLLIWLRRLGVTRPARVWTAVVLLGFYLGTSEWCHCQRDTWMLFPALGALLLRRRQVVCLEGSKTDLNPFYSLAPATFLRALAEGLLWGAAFWIKPHVAIPALACWLVTCVYLKHCCRLGAGLLAADGAGLVAGGLVAGALGMAWIWRSGTWPYFWDTLLHWNPEYLARFARLRWHMRTFYLLMRLLPWGLIFLPAVAVALPALVRLLQWRASEPSDPSAVAAEPARAASRDLALLSCFYLAWVFQAAYLQAPHDYTLVSPVLVGIALLSARGWPVDRSPLGYLLLAGFLSVAAARYPLFEPSRLAAWPRCLTEGSSAELRDMLKVTAEVPSWQDLERVRDFLRSQGVGDGELTCYDNASHPLYLDLGIRPSTRYIHFQTILGYFPSRREQIRRELAAGPQRFVVDDDRLTRLGDQASALAPAEGQPSRPARRSGRFPWTQPVVFRAGHLVVLRAGRPIGELCCEAEDWFKILE
jgi:hypothetical protein